MEDSCESDGKLYMTAGQMGIRLFYCKNILPQICADKR